MGGLEQELPNNINDFVRIENLVLKFEQTLSNDKTSAVWFDSEEIEDIFNFYLNTADYDKAEKILQLGDCLHPTDEIITLLKAQLLIERGQANEAIALLDSLQLISDYFWNYLRFAAFAELACWEQAKQAADDAFAHSANISATAIDIAYVFCEHNQTEKALSYLNQADNKTADNEELLDTILYCLCELGKFTEAMSYVERMIDINPYSVKAWQTRSSIHIELDQYELALEDLEYALAINPSSEKLLVAKVKLLFTLKRYQEADKLLDEITQVSPMWRKICIMLRGDMLFWQGEYKEAYSYYKKGYNLDFFLADSVMHYIDCAIQLKKWKLVIKLANDLLDFTPNDLKLLEKISDAYFELKQPEMSAKILRRCLRIESDNVYILMRYGSLLLDMHDLKKAYTVIHKAYRLAPNISFTNLLMAVIYYLKEDYKRMCHYYNQACKVDDNATDTFINLCPDIESMINRLDVLTIDKTKK